MTEQPPPSAEAIELAVRVRVTEPGRQGGVTPRMTVTEMAVEIDALCEQRVSAETERCAALVKPSMAFEECVYREAQDTPEFQNSITHADDFIRLGLTGILRREFRDVGRAIRDGSRAPAERPAAPPSLREAAAAVLRLKDGPEFIGLGASLIIHGIPEDVNAAEATFDTLRAALATSSTPSALASTGEQPDCENWGEEVHRLQVEIATRQSRLQRLVCGDPMVGIGMAQAAPPTDAGGLSSTDKEEDFVKGSV